MTTNDPVEVAEDYAMLQNLAGGRLDLVIGRGNTVPVYPWFGKREHVQAHFVGLLRDPHHGPDAFGIAGRLSAVRGSRVMSPTDKIPTCMTPASCARLI